MKHKPKSTLLAGISGTVKPKHTVHFKKQSIISAKFSRKLPLNKRGKYAATQSLWKMCAIEREHSRYIVHTEATEAMRSRCRCAVLLSSEQRVMWPNEVAILKKKLWCFRDVEKSFTSFRGVNTFLHKWRDFHKIFPDNAANLEKVERRFQILVTLFPTHP